MWELSEETNYPEFQLRGFRELSALLPSLPPPRSTCACKLTKVLATICCLKTQGEELDPVQAQWWAAGSEEKLWVCGLPGKPSCHDLHGRGCVSPPI